MRQVLLGLQHKYMYYK